MAHELKKRKKKFRAEIVNLHPAMRAFTDSFIVSNYTVSELHHCITHSVKNTHFFTGKVIVTASKRYFGIVVPQLDRGVFSDFCGETSTHIKKTESASK